MTHSFTDHMSMLLSVWKSSMPFRAPEIVAGDGIIVGDDEVGGLA
jgi:hypothetical protein